MRDRRPGRVRDPLADDIIEAAEERYWQLARRIWPVYVLFGVLFIAVLCFGIYWEQVVIGD